MLARGVSRITTRVSRSCAGAVTTSRRDRRLGRRGGTLRSVLAASADTSFSLAPGPIVICLALIGVYVVRWRRVRATGNTRGATVDRLVAWLAGVLCIAIALISPIDTLADQVFGMHMVQHVLLLDLAPILLIVGLTKVLLRPVARQVLDLERALGPLAHPAFAVALYVGFMWLWHVPALYDAALQHSAVHVLEHTCFLTAGLLYWWHLLSPVRGRHLDRTGAGRLHGLDEGARRPARDRPDLRAGCHLQLLRAPTAGVGADPGDDQALAGAIMAPEQSIVMGIALAYLFVRALAESDREDERADRYADVG